MLTRLYRHGSSRQSISKGYVVDGPSPDKIVQQVIREQSTLLRSAGADGITLQTSQRQPNIIWFETGMTWLHTYRARESRFSELSNAVSTIATRIIQSGGMLLPGAVSPVQNSSWRPYLCDDLHRFQTSDDLETAAFCNLLRLELPTLIAASGRAGASPRGVETGGSRRLAESTQHHPPHYLIAATPSHLRRVVRCLQRDEGISRLDMLDVYPKFTDGSTETFVELRFNDAQALISTVRAQALLYQAMFICSRRRSRHEQIFPADSQRILQRNRSRAIAEGLQARFEYETEDRRSRQQRSGKPNVWYQTARSGLLALFEKLQYELQVLEAEYEEVAPLVLGTTLRRLGHAALQNENDLLRMIHRQRPGDNLAHSVAQMIRDPSFAGDIVRWNEQLFPLAAAEVRDWWEQFLRTPTEQESKVIGVRR